MTIIKILTLTGLTLLLVAVIGLVVSRRVDNQITEHEQTINPSSLMPGPSITPLALTSSPPPRVTSQPQKQANFAACLPTGYTLASLAAIEDGRIIKNLTAYGASCSAQGRLVDSRDEEITFYRITNCGGVDNAEAGQQDIATITQLEEKYRVIILPCHDGGPYPPTSGS